MKSLVHWKYGYGYKMFLVERLRKTNRYFWLGPLVLMFFLISTTCPANDDWARNEQLFRANVDVILDAYNIPSLSACILKKNTDGVWEIAWEDVYGYQVALLPKIKAVRSTIYAIGSITKTFSATAVMKLVDEGLIDLDEDVSSYLPFQIKNPGLSCDVLDTSVGPITIRHLLSHRSGLPRTPVDFFTQYKDLTWLDFGVFPTIESMRHYLDKKESWAHKSPDTGESEVFFKPGEKYCYSNVGYLILGVVVDQIINKDVPVEKRRTWKHYVIENILNPLGMENTKFYWLDYPIGTSRAQGYIEKSFLSRPNPDFIDKVDGSIPKYILVPQNPPIKNPTLGIQYNVGGAAGQMLSTARDLAYFMTVHLNAGVGYMRNPQGGIIYGKDHKPKDVRILSDKSVQIMHDFDDADLCKVENSYDTGLAKLTGYALGWMRLNWGGRYWNYPWNPGIDPDKGVDWQKLETAGISRAEMLRINGEDKGGGLDVEGNGGDLPGFHSGMYRVSDNLAIIYLVTENYSEEKRDESRMQPDRFAYNTTQYTGGDEIKGYDGALPHNLVKYSEIQHLLLQKAASLR